MSTIVFDATPPPTRNRLTIFFRAIMIIPHFFTLIAYGIGLFFTSIIAWFALLFTGRYPQGLYSFNSNAIRYVARVNSYMYLLGDAYPPFDLGEHPEYETRMLFGPPQEKYNRVLVLFRLILFIPVYIIIYVLNIVISVVAVLLWVMGVITGNAPKGLWDAQFFALSYTARGYAYFLCLSDDWPAIQQDRTSLPPSAGGTGSLPPTFAPPAGSPVPPPPPPPPSPGGPSLQKNPFGE